jgi:hypothetical protein
MKLILAMFFLGALVTSASAQTCSLTLMIQPDGSVTDAKQNPSQSTPVDYKKCPKTVITFQPAGSFFIVGFSNPGKAKVGTPCEEGFLFEGSYATCTISSKSLKKAAKTCDDPAGICFEYVAAGPAGLQDPKVVVTGYSLENKRYKH